MLVALRRAAVASTLGAQLAPISGQTPDSTSAERPTLTIRAQATALVSRVDPALAGQPYTEGYLVQPVIMARGTAFRGRLAGFLTLDFEGLTLERGQLTPGAYGEGYADRRHPHTYLHEAILVAEGAFLGTRVSLAGGKGFVPFGTDDPMTRPFAAYPVNHHLAQVLERYVAIAGMRRGPVVLEATLFNGDEPRSPGAPPDASRFGDSWSARVTITPTRSVELQGSHAYVTSPELAGGGGLDQRKWSTAARLDRAGGFPRYALVEWARTDALFGDLRTSSFFSLLAEASAVARSVTVAGRYENTTRPEEERLLNRFRTSRSPTDFGLNGITRWQTGTVAASVSRALGRVDLAPFVEAAYARATQDVKPSAFVPREFYGSSSIWMLSAGVRVGAGAGHRRMGRYGAALPNVQPGPSHAGH